MAFLLPPPSHLHLNNRTAPTSNLHRPTNTTTSSVPLAAAGLQTMPPPIRDSTDRRNSSDGGGGRNEFYLNVGVAIRTLREDMPALFAKELNYAIYRDDITFLDPLNTFHGIDRYKLIFWALRFHGRIFFKDIRLEVLRIWQPSETMILIRWKLKGVPRVPWEAKGQFQGTSRYKFDRNGKIYEHKVDNLDFNFPPRMEMVKPTTMMLDLLVSAATYPATPTNMPFLMESSSWMELYFAVKETLEQEGDMVSKWTVDYQSRAFLSA